MEEDEDMADMTYSAEQVERLLSCSVCLERYNNPRILPCQHTFCRTPCLQGLIDPRSRKLKCPECRKEHVVPPNGAAGFPANITISNFLDLPAQRSGSMADSTTNKCRVCEVETNVAKCFHCDKMVCDGCKRGHVTQMRNDISRLLAQLRRGVPKLSGEISRVEQRSEELQQETEQVQAEVTAEVDRFVAELHERQRVLHRELDSLLQVQLRVLRTHQEGLELDLASINSFCDSYESLLAQPGTEVPEPELKAMRTQCNEYIQKLRQAETMPPSHAPRFRHNGRMLRQAITAFGIAEGPSSAPGAPATSRGSDQQQNAQRRRWQDRPQVNFYEPTSPAPASGPSTRRSLSPPATWQSPREGGANVRGSQSSVVDYRSYLGPNPGSHPGNERPPARISDYVFSMDTNPQVSTAVRYLNDPITQHVRDRAMAAIYARERNGDRMAALIGGGPNGGPIYSEENLNNNAVLRRPQEAPVLPNFHPQRDPRPTEYYEIDMDGNPNRIALPNTIPSRRQREDNAVSASEGPSGNLNESTAGESHQAEGTASAPEVPLQRNATFVREQPENPTSNAESNEESAPEASADRTMDSEEINNLIEEAVNEMPTQGPSVDYLSKKVPVLKIGGQRGSAEGQFKLPRGLAVSPVDGHIYVADSSNHRVQVFSASGQFVKSFGSYGESDGEFDCLAGVAISSSGDIIISDRYNHRIQVFDQSGRFKLKFGREGNRDGLLSYPWGVAVDQEGLIYVCDKENHRVQVFGADGTFLRKFGGSGRRTGQMENPYFLAVSPDNRLFVSDTHNHRIQVFDLQGRFLSSFGGQGSEDGKFKNPKGIAVDREGFVVVADSGNHRIQVLRADGSFVAKFGARGKGDQCFKEPEGVALTTDGKILVCDKDNYRILGF